MIRLLIKSKWLWITLTLLLMLLIILVFFTAAQVYTSNAYWKHRFKTVTVYKRIQDKPQKITLNQAMKNWLNDSNNKNMKFYRVVIKGYGSYGEVLHGSGVVRSNIKHFYLTEQQITVEGNVLKITDGIFCGNWELIPITPQEYIYNKINAK